ncbi:MAG: hypothetical protein Q4G66_11110 [bacterium]|nr:hypothetical protein [bacterium]
MQVLRNNPEMQAKRNVAEAIERGDLAASLWYLERRSSEFKARQKVAVEQPEAALSAEETLRRLEVLVTRARALSLA